MASRVLSGIIPIPRTTATRRRACHWTPQRLDFLLTDGGVDGYRYGRVFPAESCCLQSQAYSPSTFSSSPKENSLSAPARQAYSPLCFAGQAKPAVGALALSLRAKSWLSFQFKADRGDC